MRRERTRIRELLPSVLVVVVLLAGGFGAVALGTGSRHVDDTRSRPTPVPGSERTLVKDSSRRGTAYEIYSFEPVGAPNGGVCLGLRTTRGGGMSFGPSGEQVSTAATRVDEDWIVVSTVPDGAASAEVRVRGRKVGRGMARVTGALRYAYSRVPAVPAASSASADAPVPAMSGVLEVVALDAAGNVLGRASTERPVATPSP